ncbi:MAG: SMC-Scp complex subunit ScpB [Candidatus Hodarchaeales archaeon]|jgi:chromosome segregation and condensation protein ScpB
MFRLFRRKKKEDTTETVTEKIPVEEVVDDESIIPETTISETIEDSSQEIKAFETKETPFEDKFTQLTHILPESLLEEEFVPEKQIILPFIKKVVEQDSSFSDFISPQILSQISSDETLSREEEYTITRRELPPASLEERIEGALFSVGRPIHSEELIENFEEDSPTIKRAIRRLSRKRKRNSALVIHEISKDRWVMQLNPIFHEFFQPLLPDNFLLPDERRILTEIAYRQPISLAMVKKMVVGIGPIKVTEICKKLEGQNFIISEQRARSLIYTSTPKFAKSFGFDNESRRLKLQMLWRLKRLMGDFEEEPEDLEEEEEGEVPEMTSTDDLPSESVEAPEFGDPLESSSQEVQAHEETTLQTIDTRGMTVEENVKINEGLIKEVEAIKLEGKSEEE